MRTAELSICTPAGVIELSEVCEEHEGEFDDPWAGFKLWYNQDTGEPFNATVKTDNGQVEVGIYIHNIVFYSITTTETNDEEV